MEHVKEVAAEAVYDALRHFEGALVVDPTSQAAEYARRVLVDAIDDLDRERREALSQAESAEKGCEIAYRREPTQAEGDAFEHQTHADGQRFPTGECFVPMGGWTGRRCRFCACWVWGGPTMCRACIAREAARCVERMSPDEFIVEAVSSDAIFPDALVVWMRPIGSAVETDYPLDDFAESDRARLVPGARVRLHHERRVSDGASVERWEVVT